MPETAENLHEQPQRAPETEPDKTVNKDQKPAPEQGVTDVFSSIVKDQATSFPDVTADYAEKVAAKKKQQDTEEHNNRRRRDSQGVYFDPAIHKVDQETGEPQKTKKGLWVMKRGHKRSEGKTKLRLPRDRSAAPDPEEQAQEQQQQEMELQKQAADAAAEQTAAAFWALMCTVFGKDGQPDQDEAQQLPPALSAYYQQTGKIPQMPAWAPPLIIAGTAVNKRLQKNPTKKEAAVHIAKTAYTKARSFLSKVF